MDIGDSIYDRIGSERIINAGGTKTRFGGPRIREEAADAMREAAKYCANITDLQEVASKRLQAVTGAEAGHVTSGASAALTLATAACITRMDYGKMARLPNTEGIPNEVLIPRYMRNTYDHAFRDAGAKIVDIGHCDFSHGQETSNVELWEIEDAITENTAAIGFVPLPGNQITLERVTQVADQNDVPVIIDGAGTLPPTNNLTRYIEHGANLVAFSGGKGIRGPQGTGFLIGDGPLVEAAAVQHLDMDVHRTVWERSTRASHDQVQSGVPRHGIGRGFKVGKEDIIGFLTALDLFVDEDTGNLQDQWMWRLRAIKDLIEDIPTVDSAITPEQLINPSDAIYRSEILPTLQVFIEDPDLTAVEIVKSLNRGHPPIYVGARDVENNSFSINPFSLTDDEAVLVGQRIQELIN